MAMELCDVYALMERFQASGLAELEVTLNGDHVRLKSAVPAGAAAPAVPQTAVPAPTQPDAVREELCIRAPLVGTFYAAPSPDSDPFVKAGGMVRKGQPVCLIEAMKMMSEVPAPCDCIVEAVLVSDGELVAYDAPLFRIREC